MMYTFEETEHLEYSIVGISVWDCDFVIVIIKLESFNNDFYSSLHRVYSLHS